MPLSTVLAGSVFALLCAAVAVIDARTRRIPNPLNLLIGLTGLAATWALQRPFIDSLIGAALGYLSLFSLNAAYAARRGRDALGMGDAKFLAASGAWVGWAGLPFIVLLGASFGLIFVAGQRLRGKALRAGDAIAFGPFLALGASIVWWVMLAA